MAQFIVRVELRDTERKHPDYGRLHKAMRDSGYSILLRDARGLWRLPNGDYYAANKSTAEQVLAEVAAIASKIKPHPAVLVTQAAKISHHGLRLVINTARVAAALSARKTKGNAAIAPVLGTVAEILKRKRN